MLRFGGKRAARDYLGRREQYRLLTLFGVLALVVALMRVAGRPESWNWFNTLAPPDQPTRVAADEGPIDTRRPKSLNATDAPDVMRVGPALPAKKPDATESLPGLRRDSFSSVIDDTVLRGGEEHEAFFRTLATLRKLDEQSADVPKPDEVTFVQLFRQPEAYRGEWVRVRGVVRRALPITTPKNEHGITDMHQLWLQPEGRPDDLLAIDVLQLPPGFPTGEKTDAPVTVDGVFFKRWAYHAEDGIRTAPLILARTVVWTPVAATPATERFTAYQPLEIALGVGGILAVLAVVAWLARGNNREIRPSKVDPAALNQLGDRDHGNDVARMLAELSVRQDESQDGGSAKGIGT